MSSNQVKKVTDEQRQTADDAVQKMLKKMQDERDAVKNDETGIKTLEVASRQVSVKMCYLVQVPPNKLKSNSLMFSLLGHSIHSCSSWRL